jgi:hypothetical protein
MDAGLVREEKVVQPTRDGVIEKSWQWGQA